MKIRPVRSYNPPAYPDRLQTEHTPALLSRHVPAAWLRNELVAGALAALTLEGCIKSDCSEYDGNVSRKIAEVRDWFRTRRGSATDVARRVAPVFIHGEGRGSIGCIVTNPPVFLSESEASEIIESEFRNEGLVFRDRGLRVEGVCLDKKDDVSMWRKNDPGPTLVGLGPKAPLTLDAVDPARQVAYVYVSAVDSRIWDNLNSTVKRYFTIDLAEHVHEALDSRSHLNAAVFYDPLTRSRRHAREGENSVPEDWSAEKQSAADLRLQVRDFIAWAKREGVLK